VRRSRPQSGFAMTEALVTLVVLSLAALGHAALQLRSLGAQYVCDSSAPTFMLASDAADRMRANPAGVAAGR